MIAHEIIGDDMQAVIISMTQGDVIRAEAGAMMYMTDGIDMDAKMEGGFLGGLKRKLLAGESFFITYFRCTSSAARVAFAGPYPGKIIPVTITPDRPLLCQKDAFLCAKGEVDINVAFTKRIGAGFFGGEGFILQKLTGNGQTFIHSGGTILPSEIEELHKYGVSRIYSPDDGRSMGLQGMIDDLIKQCDFEKRPAASVDAPCERRPRVSTTTCMTSEFESGFPSGPTTRPVMRT